MLQNKIMLQNLCFRNGHELAKEIYLKRFKQDYSFIFDNTKNWSTHNNSVLFNYV